MPLRVLENAPKKPARMELNCARMAVPADRHSKRVVTQS
jgi:hypothetical protein